MAIITTAEYKTYAGISGSALDAQLNVLIPGLQAELERQTGRKFDTATFVEYIDGADSPTISVQNPPIYILNTVQLINRAGTVVYTYASTAYRYEAETGLISMRAGGLWGRTNQYAPLPGPMTFENAPQFPDGWRNIKVSYVGGYEDPGSGGYDYPIDLKLLMYDLTSTRLAQIGVDLSMKSETLGHYKYDRGIGADGTDIWTIYATRVAAWKRVST